MSADPIFGDDHLSPLFSIDPQDKSDNDSISSVEIVSEYEDHETYEGLDTENGSLGVGKDAPKFEEPKIGKEFPTDHAAYKFYNMYAFHIGFSVRKENVRKNRKNISTMRFFSCSKAGVYRNPKGDKPRKRNELNTRTNCKAHMKINICKKGVYAVTSFDPKHNHILTTPSKRRFLKSHKAMNDSQKAIADVAESAGLKPKQTYDFLAKQAGGRKHLTFLPDDYKNYLRSKRMHAMALGDAGAIMQYLQTRVKEDPNFYYALQIDEDDLITNIFWADGRSLLDYDCFGDVICFDSTYKTNEYGRPFAPFVGVNHHKQTVVFGAGLLYDEKISSFEWLFQTFMHAVGGKAPKVILTDQDAAMSRAIANVWPNTTHRLCVWHMYQNAGKHLSHVFNGSKSFERDFSNCVYDCEDEEDFLEAWNNMIEKYELSQNKWLTELFEIRKKWALVYGRQVFCADMKSTQRSESFNSNIKRYLWPTQRLLDFFNHYERLLEERRDAELLSDFRASQGIPSFQFSEMLKQAGAILTPAVYKVFQAEYMRFLNCEAHYDGQSDNMHKYCVVSGGSGKKKSFIVWYDNLEDNITCSCLKFEFVGVQCCHVIKVLDTLNIKLLPEKYYLKRWRKDAKSGRKVDCEGYIESDPKLDKASRYSSMLRVYTSIFASASQSQRATNYVIENANVLLSSIEALNVEENIEKISQGNARVEDEGPSNQCVPPNSDLSCPSKVPKGIKKRDGGKGFRRFKSCLEKKKRGNNNNGRNKQSASGAFGSSRSANNQSQSSGDPLLISPSVLPEMFAYGSASALLNSMHAGQFGG